MKTTIALMVAVVWTLNAFCLHANPTPSRPFPPPGPHPTWIMPKIPADPSVKITYADGGGTVNLTVEGEYYRAVNQCVGLEGTKGVTLVDVLTKYAEPKHKDTRAYYVRFYPEWGCKWTNRGDNAETSYYDGQGQPLKNERGEPMIPKSFKFNPKYVTPEPAN